LKTKKPQVTGMIIGVKRENFFKIGGFDERKQIMEDFDFSERIAKSGKIAITHDTCVLTSTRRIEKWRKIKNAKSLVSYFAYLFTGKGIGKYEPIRRSYSKLLPIRYVPTAKDMIVPTITIAPSIYGRTEFATTILPVATPPFCTAIVTF
jgi:GT2 family glycosyltransferase